MRYETKGKRNIDLGFDIPENKELKIVDNLGERPQFIVLGGRKIHLTSKPSEYIDVELVDRPIQMANSDILQSASAFDVGQEVNAIIEKQNAIKQAFAEILVFKNEIDSKLAEHELLIDGQVSELGQKQALYKQATDSSLIELSNGIKLNSGDIQNIYSLISELNQKATDTDLGIKDIVSVLNEHEHPKETKESIGLGKADNTSDIEKPISKATQEALDTKVSITEFNDIVEKITKLQKKQKDFQRGIDSLGGFGIGTVNLEGGKTGEVLTKRSNQDGDYIWKKLDNLAEHNSLSGRDDEDCHPISSITNLETTLGGKQDTIDDLETIRSGSSAGSTAVQPDDMSTAISNHNTSEQAHTYIQGLITSETSNRENADNGLQSQIDAITASSDVKDIVGTYAQLQAYDTSTLGNNDIIKVLQDETHSNETTYYRWSTTTETFTLIGEEGPYYTKSEANSTFVPQTRTVNGKALSSNISLTASDVGALPSSTVIPTVNDATLTIQKNGTTVNTFTANSSSNVTANITVPTTTSELTNNSGFITSSALSGYLPLTGGNITGDLTVKTNFNVGKLELADGVAPVEYIETSNGAYADIKVYGNTNTQIEVIDVMPISVPDASTYVFQICGDITTSSKGLSLDGVKYDTSADAQAGSTRFSDVAQNWPPAAGMRFNYKYSITINKDCTRRTSTDDTEYPDITLTYPNPASFTTSGTLWICRTHGSSRYMNARFYGGFKLYNSGVLYMNLVPAKTTRAVTISGESFNANVAGFFDTIGGKFYKATSGTFTASGTGVVNYKVSATTGNSVLFGQDSSIKLDASVDSSDYSQKLVSSKWVKDNLRGYLPEAGGNISGDLTIKDEVSVGDGIVNAISGYTFYDHITLGSATYVQLVSSMQVDRIKMVVNGSFSSYSGYGYYDLITGSKYTIPCGTNGGQGTVTIGNYSFSSSLIVPAQSTFTMTTNKNVVEYSFKTSTIDDGHSTTMLTPLCLQSSVSTTIILGSSAAHPSFDINYVRIYDTSTGELKHLFVPAKNSSNNVGMYDIVTNTFKLPYGNNASIGSDSPVVDTSYFSGTNVALDYYIGSNNTPRIKLSGDGKTELVETPLGTATGKEIVDAEWVLGKGYTSNAGTVTSVNNTSPDGNGNVSISIPSEVTETTVSNWGFTKNTGTVTSVNNVSPVSGNVTLSIPTVNNPTITITQGGVTKGSFTLNQASGDTIALDAGGSSYSAGTGIDITGGVISNDGVRSISTGATNGTISVNTGGTSAEVSVYGLGSAAYTSSSDYVNTNASNLSATGESYLSGIGMPSDTYEDVTLPANGGTVKAPANGYYTLRKASSAASQYSGLSNLGQSGLSEIFGVFSDSPVSGRQLIVTIPAKKGDYIQVGYNLGGATSFFRFIYAEGEV